MSKVLTPQIIDGIKCFNPDVANSYNDYPDEGFDLTEKSSEKSFWVRSRNRLFKSIVSKLIYKDRKTKILEIGCGNGGFIKNIVENDNIIITGSEIYVKGLRYAQKLVPNVNFIQFDVSQGIIDERFHIILAFDVLEHIENDLAALNNIKNMLEIGGKIIISVPQHMFLWSSLDQIVKHKRRYSRADMLYKIKISGLKVNYCTSFVFTLFPLMVISRIMEKKKNKFDTEEAALRKKVEIPRLLNYIFDKLMYIDELLIKFRFSLPIGGTLVVIAERQCDNKKF